MPVYISIIHNRKTRYISLGIKVHPKKDWDAKRLRVRKSFPNATRVNNYIAKKVSEAEVLTIELETNSKNLTSQSIKEAINGKPAEDFFRFAEILIQRLDQADQ